MLTELVTRGKLNVLLVIFLGQVSIIVLRHFFVGNLLSLPFQRNWIHLFGSSYEKVIAFQVLLFLSVLLGIGLSGRTRLGLSDPQVCIQVG